MRREMIILGNKALNHLRNLYKLNPTVLEIKASTGLPDESKYWNSPSVCGLPCAGCLVMNMSKGEDVRALRRI